MNIYWHFNLFKIFLTVHPVSCAGIPRGAGEAEDAAGPPLLAAQPGGGDCCPQGIRLDHPGLPPGIHTQGIDTQIRYI